MRYELTDYEWAAIKPFLPNKPRGVPRVNDRRVLNGIFWVLRSGAPWRDLPQELGPYTICYNRFVRWRRAGPSPGSAKEPTLAPVWRRLFGYHHHVPALPVRPHDACARALILVASFVR
jgi:hypothetical protein